MLALGHLGVCVLLYPEVNPYVAADANGDGAIDFSDIDTFVELLGTAARGPCRGGDNHPGTALDGDFVNTLGGGGRLIGNAA